ncbi:hypothetical protein EBZ35_04515 [bacterium]|nr:hypothetical protein [bacterium]
MSFFNLAWCLCNTSSGDSIRNFSACQSFIDLVKRGCFGMHTHKVNQIDSTKGHHDNQTLSGSVARLCVLPSWHGSLSNQVKDTYGR